MATNAAKYGALSSPQGTLVRHVVGRLARISSIVWRERLPSFEVPSADIKGFGTQLIDRTLGGSLGARIERTYHADGLECRLVSSRLAKLFPGEEG